MNKKTILDLFDGDFEKCERFARDTAAQTSTPEMGSRYVGVQSVRSQLSVRIARIIVRQADQHGWIHVCEREAVFDMFEPCPSLRVFFNRIRERFRVSEPKFIHPDKSRLTNEEAEAMFYGEDDGQESA